MDTKPPLPPFTPETARQKVRMAEDAWNTRDPDRVVLVYSTDTRWRNRAEFPVGRDEVRAFLQRKWARELDYRLIKELWACADAHSGVGGAAGGAPLASTSQSRQSCKREPRSRVTRAPCWRRPPTSGRSRFATRPSM